MIVKLLTEHHLECLSLKEVKEARLGLHSHVKMPHCWKSHATAHIRAGCFTCGTMSVICECDIT